MQKNSSGNSGSSQSSSSQSSSYSSGASNQNALKELIIKILTGGNKNNK